MASSTVGRGLKAKEIAGRVGVSASSVYSWTKALREREKLERDAEIARLRDGGMTQQEIADEVGVRQSTVAEIIGNSKTGKTDKELESESETAIEAVEMETGDEPEAERDEVAERSVEEQSHEPESESQAPSTEAEPDESPADEQPDSPEPEAEEATDEASVDIEPVTREPEPEPTPPARIPDDILNTARAVMVGFVESRPDGYLARLEVSASEWMTITDDSLSNELERKLLTSAAAMCLWQEWMIWYQGERTGAFTDAFGEIGPVFVRGRSGQWRIVSRLRSILRRIWA